MVFLQMPDLYTPKTPKEIDFSLGAIDLQSLLTALKSKQRKAVDKIVLLMETSEDEKVVFQCAKTLLDLNVSVAKEISVDQLTRAVAEMKRQAASGMILGKAENNTPLVDFNNIQDIGD